MRPLRQGVGSGGDIGRNRRGANRARHRREALRALASTGLVDVRPRVGATVSRPTVSEIVELFEVVAELEAFATRLACQRGRDAPVDAIVEMHTLCRQQAETRSADAYYEANTLFHRSIWIASENTVLLKQIELLNRRLSPYRRTITFNPGRTQSSEIEHETIVNALVRKDAAAAGAAMRDHVMILSEDVLHLARNLKL
ncbi:MAG: GntR family transcriptional regulator [Alphaproteobacteria bacterium HGW-Alphaproteobacteria-2]|nr:MAG: GntR family transcriptional regulator [Alphaproteobacteria bacterium HGW-Alphaproteobacteria-2]